MTSSNGNIFRVTGHLCGEFTGDPTQRPVTRSFDLFFDLHPNKWLSKQWWGWWFETLSCPLWRHCNDGNRSRWAFNPKVRKLPIKHSWSFIIADYFCIWIVHNLILSLYSDQTLSILNICEIHLWWNEFFYQAKSLVSTEAQGLLTFKRWSRLYTEPEHGTITHLFRVRSWNNGDRCMPCLFCILMVIIESVDVIMPDHATSSACTTQVIQIRQSILLNTLLWIKTISQNGFQKAKADDDVTWSGWRRISRATRLIVQ